MKTTKNTQLISKRHSQLLRLAFVMTLITLTLVTAVTPAAAQTHARPEVTLAKLKGAWQATFVGQDACGMGSALVTFTLGSSGVATNSTWQYHSANCGDGANTGLNFTIDTLNTDGSGTATLNVSESSKITLTIQVSVNSQVMNMVDITDSSHYLAATAIKQ
jgi:hypothetical protein